MNSESLPDLTEGAYSIAGFHGASSRHWIRGKEKWGEVRRERKGGQGRGVPPLLFTIYPVTTHTIRFRFDCRPIRPRCATPIRWPVMALLWYRNSIIMPRPLGGVIKRWCCLTSDVCLTSVCLSIAYIGPKSRTERPRKSKIGTEVAHVTSHRLSSSRRLDVDVEEIRAQTNCLYARSWHTIYNYYYYLKLSKWLGHHFRDQKLKGPLAEGGAYCNGFPHSLLKYTPCLLKKTFHINRF